MNGPYTQDELKSLISDPTSSLCGNFIKTLLQLPVYLYNIYKFFFDTDGTALHTIEPGDYIWSAAPAAESNHRKLCNGQELSKTTYAVLYAAIGDAYATMDGQAAPAGGNFRVPKVGGRFPLPVGAMPTSATAVTLGGVGGSEKVELQLENIPSHDHSLNDSATTNKFGRYTESDGNDNPWGSGNKDSFEGEFTFRTQLTGGNADEGKTTEPHNNVPQYFGLYCYISTGI